MIRLKDKKDRIKSIYPWILVFFWMGVIFYFSSQVSNSSNHLSKGIIHKILELFSKENMTLSEVEMDFYNNLIRKMAHFSVYFVMGMFCTNAMFHMKVKRKHWMLISLGICVLYAVSDEMHQAFVPGRGPRFFDILIDTCGAFLGTILYLRLRKKSYSSNET